MVNQACPVLPRAYYVASVGVFLDAAPEAVLGSLAAHSEFAVEQSQRDAWVSQVAILKSVLPGLAGVLFLEYSIPRLGRRIDAVLVCGAIVFVIEFKVGEACHRRADLDQVWDYALDLKNFQEASRHTPIVPILVATEAKEQSPLLAPPHEDGVYEPVKASAHGLRAWIDAAAQHIPGPPIDGVQWGDSPYHPTPTIVEAAQTLYAQHSVDSIARHDAGARNLRVTSRRIEDVVDDARGQGRKAICFVTGVPGSGKTLVGLNVATQRREKGRPTHAVFLSGNGPLVAVLREALARDEVSRRRKLGEAVRKGKVAESVKAFIQNVHHFRDEALRETRPPIDHVVIFDEAQRAWDHKQTTKFMLTKRKCATFTQSEPEFLISYMDRHTDWAVIVCLVGGGQEINTGEAGIGAWIDAVCAAFPQWYVHVSPELTDTEYGAGGAIDAIRGRPRVCFDEDLHLAVSMRSFRTENVSAFVKALLDCNVGTARQTFASLRSRYPVVLTRDLGRAKRWVREHARGSERYGLVASSGAQRLKPHAIDVRVDINPVHWFLNDRQDTRSSYYLEDAATEFQVQGLELDWTCVTWDGDLRFSGSDWTYHSFHGTAWRTVRQPDARDYLRNAYRVLLTRARQGMVIFVPAGDRDDPTRNDAYYGSTFRYLSEIGIPVLDP